jgi:signal peptidase I
MREVLDFFLEIIRIVILALVIVLPIRFFLFQPFIVKGESMEPTFKTGDYLLVDEISFRFREPKRGEVIIFKNPQNLSQKFIKRVIGLPGDTVEIKNGKVTVFDSQGNEVLNLTEVENLAFSVPSQERVTLKENEYFVLGDNFLSSFDSRYFGPLPKKNIIGRVFFRLWPFDSLGPIPAFAK